MSDHGAGSSSIYDLGYRHYEGARVGRRGTLLTLYVHGLRSCFGLGRRATSKIFPWALAIFAFVPAIIQLGVGAILSGVDQNIDIYKHEDYFTYVRIILVLFCATVAPELVGKDQRNRTLSLYFSRAVSRLDYTIAKFAALTSAMLVLTLGPQLLLFIGNGMAADDLGGYVRDNWDLVFPIVGWIAPRLRRDRLGRALHCRVPSTSGLFDGGDRRRVRSHARDRAHPDGVRSTPLRAVRAARQPGRVGGSDPLVLPRRCRTRGTCSRMQASGDGSTSLRSWRRSRRPSR